MALRRRCMQACGLVVVLLTPLFSQDVPPSPYPTNAIDSATIRRLPLVRNSEVSSFLPRTSIRLDYDTRVRGALNGTEFRLEGIPLNNITFGETRISFAPRMLTAVRLWSDGTPVNFGQANVVEYTSAPGDGPWAASLSVGTDAGMSGSIGNVRADAAAGGSIGPLRLRATLHAQSAQETEFNHVPGVTFYQNAGIDTVVTISGATGLREVGVPAFEEFDGLPGSGWDDMATTARVDWLPVASRTSAFAMLHYNRLQELVFPAEHLFNYGAQAGRRNNSVLLALGAAHQLSEAASISLRVARTTDERTSGVLAAGAGSALRSRDLGISLEDYRFLLDNTRFRLTDELVAAVRTNNTAVATPFFARHDLVATTEFRLNPYGTFDFTTTGVTSERYAFDREQRTFLSGQWSGRFGVHHINAGAEASFIQSEGVSTEYTTMFGMEIWREEPGVYALFAQDAFTLGDAAVSVGMRFDAFDNAAEYGNVPAHLAEGIGFFTPEPSTAFSPRLAVLFPLPSGGVHVSIVRSAQPARLYEQYRTIHTDFLRFGNAPSNTVFSRPLGLVRATHVSGAAFFAATPRLELRASGFWNQTANGVFAERITIDDPTNPGIPQSLNIIAQQAAREITGGDVSARYRLNARNFAQLSATYEDIATDVGSAIVAEDDLQSIALNGLAQLGGFTALPGLDVTLSLRAFSVDQPEPLDVFSAPPEVSWIMRFDARVAYGVRIGSLHGSLWTNLLRLAESDPYVELLSARDRRIYIETNRRILGGNEMNDALSLGSLAEAGDGFWHDVDLIAARRAEARFGNGDLVFTAEEQERAFGAAADYLAIRAHQLSQQRRIEIGLELSF